MEKHNCNHNAQWFNMNARHWIYLTNVDSIRMPTIEQEDWHSRWCIDLLFEATLLYEINASNKKLSYRTTTAVIYYE